MRAAKPEWGLRTSMMTASSEYVLEDYPLILYGTLRKCNEPNVTFAGGLYE
jgi:hypothetical protein